MYIHGLKLSAWGPLALAARDSLDGLAVLNVIQDIQGRAVLPEPGDNPGVSRVAPQPGGELRKLFGGHPVDEALQGGNLPLESLRGFLAAVGRPPVRGPGLEPLRRSGVP